MFLFRINIQALELWEEVGKRQNKEKTQEDCCWYPAACSDGTRYAADYCILLVLAFCVYNVDVLIDPAVLLQAWTEVVGA